MTAFFLFAGLFTFAWFIYDAVFKHPEMFKHVLVWLAVLLVGAAVFASGYFAPSLLSRVLVNVWGFALIALPVWWSIKWILQGYRAQR
jgi:hypothetical protein